MGNECCVFAALTTCKGELVVVVVVICCIKCYQTQLCSFLRLECWSHKMLIKMLIPAMQSDD